MGWPEEVDDLLASVVRTAGAAQLMAASEVLGECLAHRLKGATDVSLSTVPVAASSRRENSTLDMRAIARKVKRKHACTDASRRCSGL